jgi:hypothetical protein
MDAAHKGSRRDCLKIIPPLLIFLSKRATYCSFNLESNVHHSLSDRLTDLDLGLSDRQKVYALAEKASDPGLLERLTDVGHTVWHKAPTTGQYII